jgi:SET domain-containing protein
MAAKKKSVTEEQVLHRKLVKLWQRGQSACCEVRGSEIHGRGVYASCYIPKEAPIIEYFGEKVDKAESERRSLLLQAKAKKTGAAAVYIFTLSKRYDVDGNFPWNTARLINHSCNPNCEAWIVGRKIIIHALRDIQAGEELTFDYGFDVDCYEDHRCFCGAANCKGYIVSREQWAELERRLQQKPRN